MHLDLVQNASLFELYKKGFKKASANVRLSILKMVIRFKNIFKKKCFRNPAHSELYATFLGYLIIAFILTYPTLTTVVFARTLKSCRFERSL